MGVKKRNFYYDKDQYRDKEGNLLFFEEVLSYEGDDDNVNLFIDCYNHRKIYSTIDEDIVPVVLTMKKIVEKCCEFWDVSHNNPKGFSVERRNEVIHLILNEGYKDISKDNRPTNNNIGEIFGISEFNVSNMDKIYSKQLVIDTKKAGSYTDLLNYVSLLKSELINLEV